MCHLEMSSPGYPRFSNTGLCKTYASVLMLKKGVWNSDKTWKLLCMLWQCLIRCHHGVLPPPDIAAPNAVAAREIHILGGGCPWPAVPPALILSKLAWEATEKQWPRGSGEGYTSLFFPTAGWHHQNGGGEHFVHPRVLESERQKTREVPGTKCPVPAEIRREQETSHRFSSLTLCHIIPHEEKFHTEIRLAGGEGEGREAVVLGGGRVSATHSSLDQHWKGLTLSCYWWFQEMAFCYHIMSDSSGITHD